jgi:hypothetical protein
VDTGIDRRGSPAVVKFASIAWVDDGRRILLHAVSGAGTVAAGDEHYFNKSVTTGSAIPRMPTSWCSKKPDERSTVFGVEISDDDRWVVITAFQGSSDSQ